ncbi:MAG: hypothetical protein JOZ67_04020 [Gammaproteobacteria bacterium]|nr:hypothetical protein [Gammaproteobacteria bacterium]MBV9698367.1 hypothetical protein [Gammaproteobacteria bacterium]
MRSRQLLTLLLGLAVSGTALAETVVVNDQVQVRESALQRPKRGISMSDVERQFGAPLSKHDTVGQPPITRWDYNGFCVVFEKDRVIDSVVTSG